MAYQQIKYEVHEGILTITLNRPDRLNAFTPVMQSEMIDAIDRADSNDDVRAIIITGAGRGFCAGADLQAGPAAFLPEGLAMQSHDAAPRITGSDWNRDEFRDGGGQLALRLYRCLKPVIAAVNGPAVGVGATMQLPMDIRIAADNASFGFVFCRRGIVPESCSSWFLPRIVGIAQALDWTYTGRVFTAEEALAGRLVSRVVAANDLLATATSIAREIADNAAPVSAALTRQMMWRMLSASGPEDAHRIESRAIASRAVAADGREGVAAFLEKRRPEFPDKVTADMPPWYTGWQE